MDRSVLASPEHEGFQKPEPTSFRPPYLNEDPWTSSTPPKDKSHWTRVRQLLKKRDGDTIGSWQEEINTQLIVSTLLSALTGAFVIETQKSLSEDPIVTAAVLLSHIAMQLNASSILPHSSLQPFSSPPPNARVVNSLLYVSLGLSLSNVTLGLLCLQWLRELKSDTPGVPDSLYTYVHCVRHTGFRKWGAKGLVSALPLLLLSSLTCFFAGLLCHVSTTDWVVSIPFGVVLGVTFAVLVLTTLLPAAVIAGHAAFHRGILSKSGGYLPIPPFHSLQSWISLQLFVTILRNAIFKKLITFPDSLRQLKHCPDWGRVSFYWHDRTESSDPILLPFLHSSGSPSSFEDVTLCLFDTQVSKQFPDGNAVRMKIQTLQYFIEQYSKKLPSATLQDLYTKLAIQLIHYFNDGGDFSDLGPPVIKFAMNIDILSTEVGTQLLHAVVQSYERQQPMDKVYWDFFWVAIMLHMNASLYPSPILIIRALNTVEEYGKRHSNAEMATTFQWQRFLFTLYIFVTSHQPYTSTDHGKRAMASILFHPVWSELVLATRAPRVAANTPSWALEALDNLDRMKTEGDLHNYAPLSFDWTVAFPSDFEASRAHISVDMDTMDPAAEAKVEGIPLQTDAGLGQPHISVDMDLAQALVDGMLLPPAPVDIEELAVDSPIAPALSLSLEDLAERVGEEAGDDAIILGIQETKDRIPTSGSSSVSASEHLEMGNDRHSLRDQEEVDLSGGEHLASRLVDAD